MGIPTTYLKYGWYIIAGAVLTGSTIYVADSTQKRITQRDAIQVILGTVERCLATQTSTNPVTYAVEPPSFVRSWVSTNGAIGTNFAWVTNQVTNSISWYTDRAMMVDLDAKIFALIPYYVDTNTVYDSTTNISMLTVTGLFASLQIGDHTNQFTAIPCWTNNVGQTNCITNAATFGPWAWRNYIVAWQERYKVLNSLKITKPQKVILNAIYALKNDVRTLKYEWDLAKAAAESNYFSYGVGTNVSFSLVNPNSLKYGYDWYDSVGLFGVCAADEYIIWEIKAAAFLGYPYISGLNTQISHKVSFWYICPEVPFIDSWWRYNGRIHNAVVTFDGHGEFFQGGWHLLRDTDWSYLSVCSNETPVGIDPAVEFPNWCDMPTYTFPANPGTARGFYCDDSATFINWQFNYCTNKYW